MQDDKPTRRALLWRRSALCFWCGRATRLDAEMNADDAATVDHVYSRLHPRRQSPVRHLPPSVLACYRCNQERGAKRPTAGETCPVLV